MPPRATARSSWCRGTATACNDLLFRWRTGALHRRHPGDRLEPPRPRAAGRDVRHPVPPHPGRPPETKTAAEAAAARARRRPRHRPGRAGPVYADAVRRDLPRTGRPGDQHPPLVPAELQGRPPVPPGLRARRQAGRCHRALRDVGPRRGPDHRAGRDAGGPRHDRRRAGRRRAGRRERGAVPCGPLAQPRPGSCSTARRPSSSADPPSAEAGGGLRQSPSSARRRTTYSWSSCADRVVERRRRVLLELLRCRSWWPAPACPQPPLRIQRS